MIKEYEEVKLFIDRKVSCNNLSSAVVVDDIFTDEYNAYDIRIIGKDEVTSKFFKDLKHIVIHKFDKIVDDLEILRESYSNQVSIIVYLKPIMEIRSEKIQKIKDNILV